jgi:hypothetical protein
MRKVLFALTLLVPVAGLAAEPTAPPNPTNVELLLKSLASAKSAQEARTLERELDDAWNHSGSPTADLLLERAQKAYGDGDIDTALDLLKRLTKIAPNFAQGWNERAAVAAEKKTSRIQWHH